MMAGLFGGARRDRGLEALQARQRAEASKDRAELEDDRARIAGAGRASRRGRQQLKSKREGGLAKALGV